jgi:hypothetical protein
MVFGDPSAIKEVSRHKNSWHVLTESGSGFGFDVKYTKGKGAPKIGDEIICHTYNGSTIQGVTLRGELLFMKTEEELEAERLERVRQHKLEQQAEFKRQRKKLDDDYASLPIEFQRRISWFRAHNPDFRWEYESYEMMVCLEAVRIATALKTDTQVRKFKKASYKRQREMVPGISDDHSGNSFDAAVHLAWYYVQNPLWAILEHGALTPLVGCDDYGCAHPRPADVMASIPRENNHAD